MEIEVFIKIMREIYSALIDFIEANDVDSEAVFTTLIKFFEKYEILKSKKEIRLIFQLISNISNHHHRTYNFFDKLEKVFRYLIKDTSSPVSNFISDHTKYNKRILFLLLDKKLIKPDEIFINSYLQNKKFYDTFYYLYPKIKEFLYEHMQKQIEKEILEQYDEEIIKFEDKCRIGENDSYICSLIRSDSVEEFISYVNRTNLSLSSKIKSSFYETNTFLIDKKPTLIEYASFFGSIQIIQYLKYNKVPLTSSLWNYAIHSNNAELIHFLEENEVKPELYKDVLQESIKCHHNDISNYIKDNFYDQKEFYDDFKDTIVISLNFFFFTNEIENLMKKINDEIVNEQIKIEEMYDSIKKLNKTVILGFTGAGKTSLSCILSGKDSKIIRSRKHARITFEGMNDYSHIPKKIPDIAIDETNKMAFIELHCFDDGEFDLVNEIMNLYSTQYLLKPQNNETKFKILIVIQGYDMECSRGRTVLRLLSRFLEMFPNLSDSEKKAIGIVINKGDPDYESSDYTVNIHDFDIHYEIEKSWFEYFFYNPNQVFIMPVASWQMEGKSFDFEDKYKILDFIKADPKINAKLEFHPFEKHLLEFWQIDNE